MENLSKFVLSFTDAKEISLFGKYRAEMQEIEPNNTKTHEEPSATNAREETEEEEEDLVDPQVILKEKCQNNVVCSKFFDELQTCTSRVNSKQKTTEQWRSDCRGVQYCDARRIPPHPSVRPVVSQFLCLFVLLFGLLC